MYIRLKSLALSALLMVPVSISAIAQSAATPGPASQPAAGGVGAWISGHPITDFVVLAIIAVSAGAYLMRQRSHG
jgi:hypothetical protein